jgi:hypothetical protein
MHTNGVVMAGKAADEVVASPSSSSDNGSPSSDTRFSRSRIALISSSVAESILWRREDADDGSVGLFNGSRSGEPLDA